MRPCCLAILFLAACSSPRAGLDAPGRPLAPATMIAPLSEDLEAYVPALGDRTRRLTAATDGGGSPSATDLAKKAQNPVADLISLPLQNNTNFNLGPGNDTQNILNIQPVIPFKLSENLNLITRTILPVVYQPALTPTGSSDFGLGDTTFSAFFSPRESKPIWGAGPIALIPTSTGSTLGAGEWGLGASGVLLAMSGPWVVGGLVSNVWSFEGSVNSFVFQPIINYNLADGWYLTSVPIITANWEATSGNRWTVPVGGGVGKIFKIGKQPMNAQIQAFYNIEHPSGGPEWQLRLQLQFLFPK